MDRWTVFGASFGIILLTWGIKMGGPLSAFYDFPSIVVVFGGGTGAAVIGYSYERFLAAFHMLKQSFLTPPEFDYLKVISNILMTAEIARKEGILALDSRLNEIENPFMQRGLQMVVDGVDVKLIEEVMTTELDSRKGRHKDVKETIDLIASVFPAFGLIGTIMGLVGLLKNMDDPAAIGPNMALALITTFYGAVAANMFLIPLGKKVEERSANEDLYGEIITRGCLLIAGGTHPRIIQERLLSYLSDKERKTFNELHLSEELKQGGKA